MRDVTEIDKAQLLDHFRHWLLKTVDIRRRKPTAVARATGIDPATISRFRSGARLPSMQQTLLLLLAFSDELKPINPGHADEVGSSSDKTLGYDYQIVMEIAKRIGDPVQTARVLLDHLAAPTIRSRKAPRDLIGEPEPVEPDRPMPESEGQGEGPGPAGRRSADLAPRSEGPQAAATQVAGHDDGPA